MFAQENARAEPYDWNCSNPDMEITCDQTSCGASDAFTPMSVSLGASEMSVCAYTGCWEGTPASVDRAGGRFETFTGYDLIFSTAPDDVADISVTVDRETGVASMIVAGSFVLPMHCVGLTH